jgi:cytochrome c-type biogenesis protein CcmH/NrfG
LSDFNSAIRLEPNEPTPWYFRAMIRLQTGDLSGAAQDADKALERIPSGSPRRADVEKLRREIRSMMSKGS